MRRLSALLACLLVCQANAQVLTGPAAYGDWREDKPGLRRLIQPAPLPAPYTSRSASRGPRVAPRPDGALPQVPDGFSVSLVAKGLDQPRTLRTAPNGDVFLAESGAGRIRILRGAGEPLVFASGLSLPFGIAFWPPGPGARYVYVAESGRVLRYPWTPGQVRPAGAAETVIPDLPQGGHWTRDVQFSPDGRQMYVSIGSSSNVSDRGEEGRAEVRVCNPDGTACTVFASGLRNCVGMAVQQAGALWCAVNERDGLGDDLPPDYVTRVQRGAFYGWPWYYIGPNGDPRHAGKHPELAGRVQVPDVLIQPHSAPLGITVYDGASFPPAYRGDLFVALHGSWNRAKRTGYKVVRIPLRNGAPTGEYEDFLTGFVQSDSAVWGRPVGVAVAQDGALLVSEDGNGTIWRVQYAAP